MTPVPAIRLEDVWVLLGNLMVLEAIHLEVQEGEILSIVGPNGSGKTTLLRTILGVVSPVRGRVFLYGEEPKAYRRCGNIGYLPQHPETDPCFPVTVWDVAAMGVLASKPMFHLLSRVEKERIRLALTRVEMVDAIHRHFGSLSGGQKQRVLIARALAMRPNLLILDEPATGLDVVGQEDFYGLLRTIRDEEGITILMVSHDIGAVSGVVDRIACLNRRIHFHGKPSECIPSDALARVFGQEVHFVYHDARCNTCHNTCRDTQ